MMNKPKDFSLSHKSEKENVCNVTSSQYNDARAYAHALANSCACANKNI